MSLIALGIACMTAMFQDPDSTARSAATLVGRVASRMGRPVADLEVSVVGTPSHTLSDSAGRFRLHPVPPGPQVVQFRRIGFQVRHFGVDLAPGASREVTVVVEPGAYELPEVIVSHRAAKPIEYAWTTRYDDFFRRRQLSLGGVFFTRADIQRRAPLRTANMLSTIPGVHLRFRHLGPSGTDVSFSRCGQVSVWIDGVKQTRPNIPRPAPGARRPDTAAMALSEMLERVPPSAIELIEVYRGVSQMPAEFLDDSCAAVAIWTR